MSEPRLPDDVRDLLDSSFGDGPALAAPADRLSPARRALRRRRAASGLLTTALVGAITTVALTGMGDGGHSAQSPAASSPTTTSPTASPTASPTETFTVSTERLGACLETLGVLLDGRTTPPSLREIDLTYDPTTGRLVLPQDSTIGVASSDGDAATVDCTIDGVRVALPTPSTDGADALAHVRARYCRELTIPVVVPPDDTTYPLPQQSPLESVVPMPRLEEFTDCLSADFDVDDGGPAPSIPEQP